jgi:hypothetical protein
MGRECVTQEWHREKDGARTEVEVVLRRQGGESDFPNIEFVGCGVRLCNCGRFLGADM